MAEIALGFVPQISSQPHEKQINCSEGGEGGVDETCKTRLSGPHGAPYAWAESRQELCETLPYYRAFQSGSYVSSAQTTSSRLRQDSDNVIKDSIPYGYLLAGFGASRDAWEHKGRVIISHGGGKSMKSIQMAKSSNNDDEFESWKENNQDKVQQTADQNLDDYQITALVHSQKNQTPIIMVMAKDYKLSHFILPCAFAVLGWYWITDSWCEREEAKGEQLGYIRWKFRFQYVENQGSPWWLRCQTLPLWNPDLARNGLWPSSAPQQPSRQSVQKKPSNSNWTSGKVLKRPFNLTSIPVPNDYINEHLVCPHCIQRSPYVFEEAWVCLSPTCNSFWKLNGDPMEGKLHLSTLFLQLRKEPLHFIHGGLPFSLLPPSHDDIQSNQGNPMRGLHCPCGRLTCRRYDQYWHCAHCGFVKSIPSVNGPNRAASTVYPAGIESNKVNQEAGIKANCKKLPNENMTVTSFIFPKELGSGEVHLIDSLNGKQVEADEILEKMQQVESSSNHSSAIPFRRHELSCHTVKGDLLSQQFTCNYGAEYKHTVKMGTTSFDQAPESILLALQFIKERTKRVISQMEEFNEVYPVKYYETQKMNFHDDGEPGLGPTVSSLSLGVEAKMIFRLKEKYTSDHQSEKSSMLEKTKTEETLNKQGDKTQDTSLGEAKESNIGTWQKENNDMNKVKQLSMANRTLLTLTLRHGCIVIQHGRKLQELIEHAVQPQMGKKQRGDDRVRIAITARRIDKVDSPQINRESKRRKTLTLRSVMKLPGGAGWINN